ncbi:ROK family protein [Pedobacter namyangjuensis]|uniref:ROK family protein n=1 Tax=Pedobacter namyangjuensis TaxID=600626 RepID=UPI001966022B|nr:ROK family protein [Pedobacter namyangjuensis]
MAKKKLVKLKIIKALLSGSKSIFDLCALVNISAPTCVALVSSLIDDKILHKEGHGNSVGGRRPDLYNILQNSFFVLSIVMERYQTKIAILDNCYNYVVSAKTYDFNISNETDPISALHKMVSLLISEAKFDIDKLTGIGISMPGLVDAKQGNNHTFIIHTDQLRSLQQALEDTFKKPVYIQNDVKSYTVAEKKFGLAKDKNDVLVLLMDWGIGLGIIMDGQLRTGTSGFSGELGHIPFVDDGILCYCGKRGCLETVASGIALAQKAKDGIQSGAYSLLNKLSDKEINEIEPHVVIDAANLGDQYAIKILADVGGQMGKSIASLIQLFNPEMIILGGKMAEAKQYITIPMQQAINTYCMSQIREKNTIVTSELGIDAGILGITSFVLENYIDKEIEKESKNKL